MFLIFIGILVLVAYRLFGKNIPNPQIVRAMQIGGVVIILIW